MKVYCSFCKHDKYTDSGFGGNAWCSIVVGIRKSYRYPSEIHLEQSESNKNNDCKHFYPSLITRLLKCRQIKMEEKWGREKRNE